MKKFKKTIAIIAAITLIASLPIVSYGADKAYVYKYNRSAEYIAYNLKVDGNSSQPAKLRYLTHNGNSYWAYCVDLDTSINASVMYARTTIGEATYIPADRASKLRAVLKGSYPVNSESTLKANMEAAGYYVKDSLSKAEAVSGTQWAIWRLSNPDRIAQPVNSPNNTDYENFAAYLLSLPGIGANNTIPITFNINAYMDGHEVVFDYGSSTNVAAINTGLTDGTLTLTVTADGTALGTDAYRIENNKIFIDASEYWEKTQFDISIDGVQTLNNDAYLYEPEGGRSTSQTLASWYGGSTAVKGTATFEYDTQYEYGLMALSGDKDIVGRDLVNGEFEFLLEGVTRNTPMPADATANNTADGTFTFDQIKFTKDQVGEYRYTVKEVNNSRSGVTYDENIIRVIVTVSYDQEKNEVVVDAKPVGRSAVEFTNKYRTSATQANFEGTKSVEGREMTEHDQYSFRLVPVTDGAPMPVDGDGNVVDTVTNDANGKIQFENIKYGAAGTYEYQIKELAVDTEKNPKLDGITNDTTVQNVKVVVKDNIEKAELYIESITYNGSNEFEFVNKYTADDANVVLEASKLIIGKRLVGGDFYFEVKDETGAVIATAANDSSGNIKFPEITYKDGEEGTYKYTVNEIVGTEEGMTYDEAVYDVTVKVTDNLEGELEADITYEKAGDPVEKAIFANKYEGQGSITVTKEFFVNGAEKHAQTEFTVGLFADKECTQRAVYADGTEVPYKVIHMNGNHSASVTFDGLEYGTYYVAEIGKDGKALAEGDVTGKLVQVAAKQEVAYENEVVTISKENPESNNTVITNCFYDEEYFYYEVQTGDDDFRLGLLASLMTAAVCAMVLASGRREDELK